MKITIDGKEHELTPRNCSALSLELEAALCAWEWMLENHGGTLLREIWDGLGSSAMRHCSMQAGAIALATYDYMESQDIEFIGSYDWEFVPEVMCRLNWPKLCDHNQYNGPAYEPDVAALLADIMKHQPHDFETPRERWISTAKREAKKQWAYEDLVSDHEDKIDSAIAAGNTPAEFVKWLGEKYDLTPVEGW